MPSSFTRTFRSLEADPDARSRLAIAGALVVLGAWTTWLFRAELSVYADSDTARIEVARATHPVDTQVSGRVVESQLGLERAVNEGDVLLVLDSEPQRLALDEAQARLKGLAPQLAASRAQIADEHSALNDFSHQNHAAIDEAKARVREATLATRAAEDEAGRLEGLRAKGAIAELDVIKARAEADKRAAAEEALRAELNKLGHGFHTDRDDRQTRIAGLQVAASRVEAELRSAEASVTTLQHDIERRTIRAPASGKIGEIAGIVRLGSVIKEGDRIATIVAQGDLRIVAQLSPASALGRVEAGQRARVRLEGFPWTEFGEVLAKVTDVASEVRDDHARVELAIVHRAPRLPLQHGMPATVEIEVERTSPARLLLRAAGQLVARQHADVPPVVAEKGR